MQKQTKTKKIFYIILCIISVAICYLVVAYWQQFFPFNKKITSNSQLQTDNTSQTTSKENTNSNSDNSNSTNPNSESESTDKTPIQNEGENPNQLTNLTGYITNKTITNDKVIIRLTINQFLKSNGQCLLTLTNQESGKKVTKTASTINNPSSATCQGFDIAKSELGTGRWTIEIKVEADGKTGTINGEEINL